MKNVIKLLVATFLTVACAFTFGCQKDDGKTIRVGASSTPHAEILDYIKGDMKSKGYNLVVMTYDDYVLPNMVVQDGSIMANYFQHEPYLNEFNTENKTDIVSVAKIHYEPFGLYGNGNEKTGKTIYIPTDGSNCTRALFLLQQEGYITLKDDASPTDILSVEDIKDNKGNDVKQMEASVVASQYLSNKSSVLAVINGNYALGAGLKIADALAVEDASGEAAQLYANIIAVKKGNEENEAVKALIESLKTKKVGLYQ